MVQGRWIRRRPNPAGKEAAVCVSPASTPARAQRGKSMHAALRSRFLLTLFSCLTFAAHAAGPVAPQCPAEEYHQLDFWIGEWDTFESDGSVKTSIARARVAPIAGGCAIHELYEQSDGLVGESILSYDPVRKQWQQTWVTNRGALMVLWGGFGQDGVLVLEGETHLQDGRTVRQRIRWERQGDAVREWAEMSKDGGTTWSPAFDLVFRKRAATQG